MEFLSTEAEDDCPLLQFSDEDEDEKIIDELDDFIDDAPIEQERIDFYRERDPSNINDYPRFNGQTRNPLKAIYSDSGLYYDENEEPELFAAENRDVVVFDSFKGFQKSAETLLNFKDVENHLFSCGIYGLMFYKKQAKPDREKAQEVLGDNLYFELLEIEPENLLDKTLFGFFDRCFKVNEVLVKYGFFLKFFERHNVYRLLIKKKYKEKMRSLEIYLLVSSKSLMDMK